MPILNTDTNNAVVPRGTTFSKFTDTSTPIALSRNGLRLTGPEDGSVAQISTDAFRDKGKFFFEVYIQSYAGYYSPKTYDGLGVNYTINDYDPAAETTWETYNNSSLMFGFMDVSDQCVLKFSPYFDNKTGNTILSVVGPDGAGLLYDSVDSYSWCRPGAIWGIAADLVAGKVDIYNDGGQHRGAFNIPTSYYRFFARMWGAPDQQAVLDFNFGQSMFRLPIPVGFTKGF